MIWSLFGLCGVLLTWIGRGVMGDVERAQKAADAATAVAVRADSIAQVHAEQIRQIKEIALRIEAKIDHHIAVGVTPARTGYLDPILPPPK